MADLNDVLTVLVGQIAQVVYPNGIGNPSVSGQACIIYPGWPIASRLDADLLEQKTHVSVFPIGSDRNVTRYAPKPNLISAVIATLTLTASGRVVTVGGVMPSPFTTHNMAVIINGVPFIYSIKSTDTLTSIATALAAMLNLAYAGTSNAGPVITLPAGVNPTVQVGTTAVMATEWERQQQRIQITTWSPDPNNRTLISSAIKQALASITFLAMPDGYGARIKSAGSAFSDSLQKANLYRRDFFYEVEYATTVTQTFTDVVAVVSSTTLT